MWFYRLCLTNEDDNNIDQSIHLFLYIFMSFSYWACTIMVSVKIYVRKLNRTQPAQLDNKREKYR